MASIAPQPETNSGPTGYLGIKAGILVDLKRVAGQTTKDLASSLGTSLNNVRHHLKQLEDKGLVEYERQHRGVGAPTFAYRLTTRGNALFPRRYETILGHLLGDLVRKDGRAGVTSLLESRYAGLAEQLRADLSDAGPAERLESLATLLSNDGYMAEATVDGSTGTLIEHNCAIQSVAEQFPEICAAEARFLSQVLGSEVRRERHILNGCSACEYRVHLEGSGSARVPAQENP
jgi:DeoR family suf operon transcriptional repressor